MMEKLYSDQQTALGGLTYYDKTSSDLAPRLILTREHAASSYGQPVVVDRETGTAYGPADILPAECCDDGASKTAAAEIARLRGDGAVAELLGGSTYAAQFIALSR